MAHLVFYDSTELDKAQLTNALKETDHYWEYQDDKISLETCNPNAEIISVFTTSTVTREMISAMPKLTLIACRSTGFNHVDLEAAADHNVTVVNVPTYGDATVAEYAFTLLLALTRKLQEVLAVENERLVMPELTGQDLLGKTFGVIGTGHIGQRAIKMGKGFSMNVIAYDKYPNEAIAKELDFKYADLDELLSQADYISLHLPYNPGTHHILNRERLLSMKKGAIVINTGRGGLVDTRALIEVLDDGHLGGAALDVLEGENLLDYEEETALLRKGEAPEELLRHSVEISALKKMPNVIVSPHNAFNTVEAIGRINQTTVDNIVGFYNHEIPNKVEAKPVEPGKLILLRHTESEWNAKGVWSGVTDINLSEKGKNDRAIVGQKLKELGLTIDVAFHTDQKRTADTLSGICQVIDDGRIRTVCESSFNERNYGEYTGMDKWKVKEEIGEEMFNQIRRGWDVPFPNGETLKEVYERVVPAYQNGVFPLLKEGKNVLIVAHGNSLRALIKYLDSIPDDEVGNLEMLMNQMMVYQVNPQTGLKESVEILDTGTKVEAKF
ncbi:2,3-bisphosphoglycerate-dependent phosphoglycerate mutase, partial [Candidatus Kaiserbacteria bacterium]|nr:2,3-bisphosphoglycerate-dependent phosphoglycerate mutase [Candidatus Kaiserbacteria bacterium]